MVFTMLFDLGSKNQAIYSVLWTAPSKNTSIVFSLLEYAVFPRKRHNTVNYIVLAFGMHKKTSNIHQKVPKMNSLFLAILGGL